MPDLQERMLQVLAEHGISGLQSDIHSWRCQYPESYGGGPCSCLQDLVDDLTRIFHQPPEGWFPFGSHLDFAGELEFSKERDEDQLPKWERPLPNKNSKET